MKSIKELLELGDKSAQEDKLREMVDMLPTIQDLLSMLSGTYYGVNIDEFKEKLKKWEG